MSRPERSVRDVQDDCARAAGVLENLIQGLVRLREELRLPPDTLALYENRDIPWPVEVEVDAALETVIDEELEPAAARLRTAARLSAERLRRGFRARHQDAEQIEGPT